MAEARFDIDALMSEFDDESLIAELAQLLLDHAGDQLGAVHNAIASGNAPALKSAAHKIKGSIGIFGATSVTNLAMTLENMGRAGNVSEAGTLAAELSHEVRALCEGASAWLIGRAA
jgi:protein-histidine pros-kinase